MSSSTNKRTEIKVLQRLLRRTAEAIGRLDPETDGLEMLKSGEFSIEILFERDSKSSSQKKNPAKPPKYKLDYDRIRKKLMSVDSLLEGEGVLAEFSPTRKDLEEISRQLDLPVNRTDRVEQLRQRIIDVTIGFRLRSQAIRGKEFSADAD